MSELKAENKRLRTALKRYANRNNWQSDDWYVLSVYHGPNHGYGDPTKSAEEALTGKRRKIKKYLKMPKRKKKTAKL